MDILAQIILLLLQIYFYIIIAEVVISWLIVFDVINIRNPQAANLVRLLRRMTDPVMNPIRKMVPPIGGIDISPLIVIFGIILLQNLVGRLMY